MFYLEATAEGFSRRVAIPLAKKTLGRGDEADIVLKHPSISKQHATIEPLGPGRFLIIDLGSSNGIQIDGLAMPRIEVTPGDSFQFGKVQLRLRQRSGGVAQPPTPATTARSWRPELWLGGGVLLVLLASGAFFLTRKGGSRAPDSDGDRSRAGARSEVEEEATDGDELSLSSAQRALAEDPHEVLQDWRSLAESMDNTCSQGACHTRHPELDFVARRGALEWGRWQRNLDIVDAHGGWREVEGEWSVAAHAEGIKQRVEERLEPGTEPGSGEDTDSVAEQLAAVAITSAEGKRALRRAQLGSGSLLSAARLELGSEVPWQGCAQIPLDRLVRQQNAWLLLRGRLPTPKELLLHNTATALEWLRGARGEAEFWRERARQRLVHHGASPRHGAFPIPPLLDPRSVPHDPQDWYRRLEELLQRLGGEDRATSARGATEHSAPPGNDASWEQGVTAYEPGFEMAYERTLAEWGTRPRAFDNHAQLLRTAWALNWGEPPSWTDEELLFGSFANGLAPAETTPRMTDLLCYSPTVRWQCDVSEIDVAVSGWSRLCRGQDVTESHLQNLRPLLRNDIRGLRTWISELLWNRAAQGVPASTSTLEPVKPQLRLEIVCEFDVRELLRHPEVIPRIWRRLQQARLQVFPQAPGSAAIWVERSLPLAAARGLVVVPDRGWVQSEQLPNRWRTADGRLLLAIRELTDLIGDAQLPQQSPRIAMRQLLGVDDAYKAPQRSSTREMFRRGGYRCGDVDSRSSGMHAPAVRTLLLAQAQVASPEDTQQGRLPVCAALRVRTSPRIDSREWEEVMTTLDLIDLETHCDIEVWLWGEVGNEKDPKHTAIRLSWGKPPMRGWVVHSDESAPQHHPLLRQMADHATPGSPVDPRSKEEDR